VITLDLLDNMTDVAFWQIKVGCKGLSINAKKPQNLI